MGKYVPERDYIHGTEQRIREVLAEYNENIWRFETKDSKRAGVRARKNLLELFHLCRKRRKEILERKQTLGYFEHPSWEGVEDE